MLLRRFYVQENEKGEDETKFRVDIDTQIIAPVPKVKKNRILKADTPNMLASSE